MNKWLIAFRLRTLPLALSSIAMGTFIAAAEGNFNGTIAILCVLTTILLQILSNLANDYGDAVNGADHHDRQGPKRMVQAGVISLEKMKVAMIIFAILSLVSGLSLLFVALGFNGYTFLIFLALGILAIIAAITYTAGKNPYGYAGFGDVSVMIFFGFVGVIGSYYLYIQQLNWALILPALSCGLFAVGVLNINNIRDIESDKLAGKNSIPVRIGRSNAITYHIAIIILGWIAALLYTYLNFSTIYQLAYVLSLPLFFINVRGISSKSSAEVLDPYLKQMALSTLIFVLLFGIGLLLA